MGLGAEQHRGHNSTVDTTGTERLIAEHVSEWVAGGGKGAVSLTGRRPPSPARAPVQPHLPARGPGGRLDQLPEGLNPCSRAQELVLHKVSRAYHHGLVPVHKHLVSFRDVLGCVFPGRTARAVH